MPEPFFALPILPTRLPNVTFSSIRELYLEFESIFLAGSQSLINSPCGHRIYCFEHHFFHLAGVRVSGTIELSMKTEKATILATNEGFGRYEIIENGSRAKHLRSAYETLVTPDEVWEDNPNVRTAKWIYIRKYDNKRYPFSIALAGDSHTRGTIIVPFSSFPIRIGDIKKWRQGTRIHPALLIS